MKISRRSVLHISGLAAAALALTGCSAAGSAALGGKLPGLFKGLAKKGETAASSEAASDMAVTPPPEGEPLDPAFGVMPEYDADILTGAERSTNSRPVAVMVNNIANSQRQNARPQRGIGSADLLIEAKVEGGITRLCAVFSDADSIPEVGPIRSGRDQFLQLLMPWDILYYHDGESIFCTQFVSVYGYSGLNIGGKNYFKTPIHPIVSHRNNRGRDVAYEHTEFTSGTEIKQAAANAGIGLDYAWFAADEGQRAIAANIQRFFSEEQKGSTEGVFLIDGTPVPGWKALHPVGLLATLAEASLASDGPYAQEWVRRFWETPLRQGDRRYYDNCLYFFALLALSGKYRIW